MLRHKRRHLSSNKKKYSELIQHKSLKEKLKSLTDDDEEIKSQSDADNDKEEDDHEKENQAEAISKTQTSAKRVENSDEVRLRLAKKLLSKIGDEIKQDSDEENAADDEVVDNYIIDEIKKEKSENFLKITEQSNFSPYESGFIKGHQGSITSLDISSDSNQVITCSKDCRAIKWDLPSGKKILLPKFSNRPLYSCSMSADDHCALFAGADRHIYNVDIHNEKVIQSTKGHNDVITGVLFDTTKDQFYSISHDHLLKVWNLGGGKNSVLLETFYGHTNKINDIDLVPGDANKIITCGMDNLINMWKIDSQSFLQFKVNDTTPIDSIKSLSKEIFFTGSYDGGITVWKSNKKRHLFKLQTAHGWQKEFELKHKFFQNHDDENLLYENLNIRIPFPILSLNCIKNSDLLFSGSSDGMMNLYKYSLSTQKDFKKDIADVHCIQKLKLSQGGCINVIKPNKTNEFLVIANAKDTKIGRWDCNLKTKIGITLIKLCH